MEYRIDDKMLNTSVFLTFVNQVWSGADCRAKRTPVPYSADSLRHN